MTDRLAANHARLTDRIAAACDDAGRSPSEVTLVAVVKYAELDWVRGLVNLGVRELGEARPQQLAERVPQFPADVRWHLIGSLQRNKARVTADSLGPNGLVHSVDTVKLLRKLAAMPRCPRLLLQVNVTGEASKQGFEPGDVASALDELPDAPIDGLMTMAAKSDDRDEPRRAFEALRDLRDSLASGDRRLPLLSMGMSGDFAAAIAAGATHVRVGSALFEGL